MEKEWYEVPDEDLNFYEEMLVALLGTLSPGGYNLKEGGGNGKPSEETKQKMSEARTGKTLSEETKQKISDAQSGEKNHMFGKTLGKEHKQKISEAMSGEKAYWYGKTGEMNPMFGKEHTEETKQKMKEAKTGEKNPMFGKTLSVKTKQKMSKSTSGENNPMYGKTGEKHHASKKVYQYKLDGMYVDDFGSGGEAARALGKTDGTSICSCARGDCQSAYGFKWSYTEL